VITIDCKFSQFFDRELIVKKVKDAGKTSLSKAGAFVRQRAKTSIRKRKKVSTPGSPPSSHVGLLRNMIYFFYDEANQSVVVGPQILNGAKRNGSVVTPELMEFGGTAPHWRTKKISTWRPRPFMQPALEAEAPKFPDLFADVVK
jgi:hypothetical protein